MLLRHQDGHGRKQRPIVKRIFEEEYIRINKPQKRVSINKCEMILFFVFCLTMLLIIYLQEGIQEKFRLTTTLKNQVKVSNFQSAVDDQGVYNYLTSIITNETLYSHPTRNQPIPTRLATPIQVTQRRIKTKEVTMFNEVFRQWQNQDEGFAPDDPAGQSVQDMSTYSTGAASFKYQGKGNGFMGQGGFIYTFDSQNFVNTTASPFTDITVLKRDGWINNRTNSIVLSFAVYSAPLKTLSVIIMQARMRPNGNFRDDVEVRSIRQSYYQSSQDYFRLVLEIGYTILFIYYAVVEVKEIFDQYKTQKNEFESAIRTLDQKLSIKNFITNPEDVVKTLQAKQNEGDDVKKLASLRRTRRSCCKLFCRGCGEHFSSPWNWVDVTSLVLSFFNILFWIIFISKHTSVITGPINSQLNSATMINPQFVTDLWDVVNWHNNFITIVSINAMLIFMRVLKYLSEAVSQVSRLLTTLYKSSQMTSYFLVMLLTIFMAFSLMAYLSFGDKVLPFSTFGLSCFSLFQFVLGSAANLQNVFTLYPALSFIFFIIYMAVMQFILTNLFIGFLGTSYGEVMEQFEDEQHEIQHVGFCVRLRVGCKTFFTRTLVRCITCGCCKGRGQKQLPRHRRRGCCGKKPAPPTQQEQEIELQQIKADVRTNSKVKVDTKILQEEPNQAKKGDFTELQEHDKATLHLWDAAPAQGDILHDQKAITTLMTEQQLAEQKYKKQQYYGKVFYGGLIFLGFVVIYVIILTQQLDIEQTFLIGRDSTSSFKTKVTTGLSPSYSDYLQKVVKDVIPNLAAKQNPTDPAFTIEKQLVLVNDVYRVTWRFADVKDPNPRKLNGYAVGPRARGQQISDFTTGSNLGQYVTNDGYQGNGGFVKYISAENVSGSNNVLLTTHTAFQNQSSFLWYITYEYVVYQGSTDRFMSTVMRFLFRKDGSIEGKVDNSAIRLNPYFTTLDKFRIFLEVCYVVFLAFFIVMFIRMVIRQYRSYELWYSVVIKPLGPRQKLLRQQKNPECLRRFFHIFTFFQIIDLASMITSILSICFWIVYIVRSVQAQVTLPLRTESQQKQFFNNLNEAITFLDLYTKACSVNTLFMSIRMLKFLNENQQMSVLCKTLINGRSGIFWFMIILFSIMFGFVALANIQFGAFSQRLSTFWFASIMCFQYIIGQFSYDEELGVTNQVLAPMFFVVYLLLFTMILINIFLTIIDTSYQEVKAEVKRATGKQKLSTCNILCFCFKRKGIRRGDNGPDQHNEKQFELYNQRLFTEKKQLDYFEIDLSTQLRDQNAWTLRMAQEIKRELDFRQKLRADNQEMRKLRREWLQGAKAKSRGQKNNSQKKEVYSEFKEFYIRISYWNYLREAIQFVNFQCDRLVNEINKLKNQNHNEEVKLSNMKEDSKAVYQVIKDMERPMEQNLQNIAMLRRQVKQLKKQHGQLQKAKSEYRNYHAKK